jgi:hypothetical protein
LTLAVQYTIEQLSDLMIVGEGAKATLTDLGQWLKDTVIGAVMQFTKVLKSAIKVVQEWSNSGLVNISVLKLYFLPLTIVIGLIDLLGASGGKLILTLYVLSKTIPLTTLAFWAFRIATGLTTMALIKFGVASATNTVIGNALAKYMATVWTPIWSFFGGTIWGVAFALTATVAGMYLFYKVGEYIATNIKGIAGAMAILAVSVALVTVAYHGLAAAAAAKSILSGWGAIAGAAGLAAAGGALGVGIGATKGWLWKGTGEEMLGTDAMDAYMVQLETRVSTNAALGSDATDLYVDNLITANDDLGERAYTSSYTTTKSTAGLGTGGF